MLPVSTRANANPLLRLAIVGLTVAGLLGAATVAQAEPITVMVDRAKVMRISRPADVVIVGNPAIADATIQDNKTLIITGRSYGSTNLIVLDADGQAIADEVITVGAPDDQVVTVYRRASRQTYSCTPNCSPTLAIGDTPGIFDSVNSQIQAHTTLSDDAANK
jgi:Flp pilus assembly secretin CpaC